MHFNLKEDFINMKLKKVCYINAKNGMEYQIRRPIYDTEFIPIEETTQVMV